MNSLQSELIAYIGNKIDDPKHIAFMRFLSI